jgi:plastocyanin
MRRLRRALPIALVISLLFPADSSAAPVRILELNFVFAPNPATAQIGQEVIWVNEPNNHQFHTTTDLSPLLLWDSGEMGPGKRFSFTFTAAATYDYVCTLHDPFGMLGTLAIKDQVSPPSGPAGTIFTITAASVEAPLGMVYDIQKRDPGDRFRQWITGVTAPSVEFDSTGQIVGKYAFRSRLRRSSDDAATAYSPAASIEVTAGAAQATAVPGSALALGTPFTRNQTGMAYSPNNRAVLLFGGTYSGAYFNDTWTWTGAKWQLQAPYNNPESRAGMGMAFDAARRRVVVFGGINFSTLRNDTWTWNGSTWRRERPATSPPARSNPGMVYDAARRQVVLFGGWAGGSFLNDTWVWDGTTWTELFPPTSPPKRADLGMAYDQARGQTVLFGGDGAGVYNDTWIWDGATWTNLDLTAAPDRRYAMGMAYDGARQEVVLFGGRDPFAFFLGDTWTWDGTAWTEENPPSSAGPRQYPGMAYDAARREMVLFGGSEAQFMNDTWVWDGTTWTERPTG